MYAYVYVEAVSEKQKSFVINRFYNISMDYCREEKVSFISINA